MRRPHLLFLHEESVRRPYRHAGHHRLAPGAGWRTFVAGWRDVETGPGGTLLHDGHEVLPGGGARPLQGPERFAPAAVIHRTWVRAPVARVLAGLAANHPSALLSHHPAWAHLSDKRDSEVAFRAAEAGGLSVSRPATLLPARGRLAEDLRAAAAAGPLILKPARGTMCHGILISTPATFAAVAAAAGRASGGWVAQELVLDTPLLRGRKLDLRVFVLVSSWRPLRMRLFREGVARLAASPFDPGRADLPAAALTGNSFRKRMRLPIENVLVSELLGHLEAEGLEVGGFWERAQETCRAAFAAYARTGWIAAAVDLERRFCLAGVDLLPVVSGRRLDALYLEMNVYAQLNGWGARVDRGLERVHRAWLADLAGLAAARDGAVTAA